MKSCNSCTGNNQENGICALPKCCPVYNVDLSTGQKQFNLPCGTVCTLSDAVICQPRKKCKRSPCQPCQPCYLSCQPCQPCQPCYQDCLPFMPCLTCQPSTNSFKVKQKCLRCQPCIYGCQPYRHVCCVKCAPYCPQCCCTIPMVPQECPFPCPTEWCLNCDDNQNENGSNKDQSCSCNLADKQNQNNFNNTCSNDEESASECGLSFNRPLCRQPCEDYNPDVRVVTYFNEFVAECDCGSSIKFIPITDL